MIGCASGAARREGIVRAGTWLGLAVALALGCTGPGAVVAKQEREQKQAQAQEGKPASFAAQAVSASATVEAVDHAQRAVLLRRQDGTLLALRLGPEVRNLDQVRKGDRVVATYLESVAIFVAEDDGRPGATTTRKVEIAPLGDKPRVVSTNVSEIRARVESVDLEKRTLTLVGESGSIGSFHVDPSVERLDEVEPGDDVVARITEATAIEVKAP